MGFLFVWAALFLLFSSPQVGALDYNDLVFSEGTLPTPVMDWVRNGIYDVVLPYNADPEEFTFSFLQNAGSTITSSHIRMEFPPNTCTEALASGVYPEAASSSSCPSSIVIHSGTTLRILLSGNYITAYLGGYDYLVTVKRLCHPLCLSCDSLGCNECIPGFTLEGDSCVCPSGYEQNGVSCDDVNECADDPDICGSNSICGNLDGSYHCSCEDGYESVDERDCSNTNECEDDHNICGSHSICEDTIGSYNCTCENGYTSNNNNGKDCSNIDECTDIPTICGNNSICTDSEGSYSCACESGYESIDGMNCTNIDECTTSTGSTGICGTHSVCTDSTPFYTCTCLGGYFSDDGSDCQDVNECVEMDGICGLHSTCSNNNGSYTCTCEDGYTSDDGSHCQDINECLQEPSVCGSHSLCGNFNGSYSCECEGGYESEDGANCSNINECAASSEVCGLNSVCSDLDGSYSCTCTEGYMSDNGTNCTNIDECSSSPSICGSHSICSDFDGSFSCTCEEGFSSGDGSNCVNIDECTINPVICGSHSLCTDQDGSYSCSCESGYTSEDGSRCENINECSINPDVCGGHSVCSDTSGSYTCLCEEGYFSEDETNCQDVNECVVNPDICGSSSTCTNTQGSYVCTCLDGFDSSQGDGSNCEDVNECEGDADVCGSHSSCENTAGSFQCSCEEGYESLSGDGSTCSDINECDFNACGPYSSCTNSIGSYSCECDEGFFSLSGDDDDCQDINECLIGEEKKCDDQELCVNHPGFFVCEDIPAPIKDINVGSGSLNPPFSSSVTEYHVNVSETTNSIDIDPKATELSNGEAVETVVSVYSLNTTQTLNNTNIFDPILVYGINVLIVRVYYPATDTFYEYVFIVERALSSETRLSSFDISRFNQKTGQIHSLFSDSSSSFNTNTSAYNFTETPFQNGFNRLILNFSVSQEGSTVVLFTRKVVSSSNLTILSGSLSERELQPLAASPPSFSSSPLSSPSFLPTALPHTSQLLASSSGDSSLQPVAGSEFKIPEGQTEVVVIVTAQNGLSRRAYTFIVERYLLPCGDLSFCSTNGVCVGIPPVDYCNCYRGYVGNDCGQVEAALAAATEVCFLSFYLFMYLCPSFLLSHFPVLSFSFSLWVTPLKHFRLLSFSPLFSFRNSHIRNTTHVHTGRCWSIRRWRWWFCGLEPCKRSIRCQYASFHPLHATTCPLHLT